MRSSRYILSSSVAYGPDTSWRLTNDAVTFAINLSAPLLLRVVALPVAAFAQSQIRIKSDSVLKLRCQMGLSPALLRKKAGWGKEEIVEVLF